MTREELSKWFNSDQEDEFFEKNVEYVKHDLKVQSETGLVGVIMLYTPDLEKYTYWQPSTLRRGESDPREIVRQLRKGRSIHYKALSDIE